MNLKFLVGGSLTFSANAENAGDVLLDGGRTGVTIVGKEVVGASDAVLTFYQDELGPGIPSTSGDVVMVAEQGGQAMVDFTEKDLCVIWDSRLCGGLVVCPRGVGGGFMDLFFREAADRIGDEDVLSKIDALLDWGAFSPILKRGLGRSGIGPRGFDPLVLSRCLLIGQWHGLSDPKLERALKVRLDFMLFCGLDLHAPVPDETTHCRFRNALVRGGVYDDLLAEVCRQIEGHGLKLKEAEAAIIDATLVESAARPRSHIEAPQDRAEGDAEDDPNVHFSADPDARWVKKGSKSTLGDKAFARTDEDGFIDRVHTTPANRAESPEFDTMTDGARAQRVLADKAYASRANRELLRGRYRDGIMRKAARNRPLRGSEKRFNKLISKRRFRVEQCFGTMKRLFGLDRARYFGVARTHAQLAPLGRLLSNRLPGNGWRRSGKTS